VLIGAIMEIALESGHLPFPFSLICYMGFLLPLIAWSLPSVTLMDI
jgi:hypothetical protein